MVPCRNVLISFMSIYSLIQSKSNHMDSMGSIWNNAEQPKLKSWSTSDLPRHAISSVHGCKGSIRIRNILKCLKFQKSFKYLLFACRKYTCLFNCSQYTPLTVNKLYWNITILQFGFLYPCHSSNQSFLLLNLFIIWVKEQKLICFEISLAS